MNLPKINVINSERSQSQNRFKRASAGIPFAYDYITTVGATVLGERKEHDMKVYYRTTRSGITTYEVPSYSGKLASFIVGTAVGLAIPEVAASKFVNAAVGSGVGVIVGDMLKIGTSRTWLATEYIQDFYGVDKANSSYNGYWKNAGFRYDIIDKNYKKAKTTYDNKYCYSGKTNDTAFWCVCDSLAYRIYGDSCEINIR